MYSEQLEGMYVIVCISMDLKDWEKVVSDDAAGWPLFWIVLFPRIMWILTIRENTERKEIQTLIHYHNFKKRIDIWQFSFRSFELGVGANVSFTCIINIT